MPPKRMTGDQLAAIRAARKETLEQFGAFLARISEADRPYTKQEVHAWEAGIRDRKVPLAVEMALIREGLAV